jgi:hypothetical protein
MVCAGDWEPRQPQDFVRGVADFQAPPFTRPEPADVFIPFNFSTSASDSTSFTESDAKVIYKNVTSALNNSAVDDQSINELALNDNSVSNDYPYESFTFTESILVAVGRSLSDTVSFSETIDFYVDSPAVMNGSALNLMSIG